MKLLATAPPQDFSVYVARADTRWVVREAADSLEILYEQGFLPYSGSANVHNVFYSAQSARVLLSTFNLTSENRRIAKKFDGMFSSMRISAQAFNADESFYKFCLSYFAAKHGAHAMPRERLRYILHSGLVSTVVVYSRASQPVAYVLEIASGHLGHYWFSFYDLAYAKQSLGLWLMQDCIRSAKERGLTHYYLGTVYGEKALYKTNFGPLEWWDGTTWIMNNQLLRERARSS